ncbi:MAG: hypothetical protein KC505_10585 [Myxococcales bacterium]|nr:hypothetical protein [Myxococcales bacterium]USN51585.1 MAG: hypothetical protein H6731_04020 [Myxococcales bacterium]
MKLKFPVFIMLTSTVGIIGGIYLLLNGADISGTTKRTQKTDSENKEKLFNQAKNYNSVNHPSHEGNFTFKNLSKKINTPKHSIAMSPQDIDYIKKLSSLSAQDLSQELNELKQRIEKSDFVLLLENKKLDATQSKDAKATLERFALLGLEATRRKYADLEPELKDALYAHQDSLREIREMLGQY